jgi:phosphate starvation-inducible PhoH-like protein
MATQPVPPPRSLTLTFGDNALLSLLLGDHDRHLSRIEQRLGVRLACRGNRVSITGSVEQVAAAEATLAALYRQLERGEMIDGPRVDAAQTAYIDQLARHEMVFALGPAGTGKTYLAVAQAVAMLTSGRVDRIVLSRPAVEAGERLGFLPGDMKEKVDPYLRPLYDALNDMLPGDQLTKRMTTGEIEIAPLAFMRGRTLAHAFVILDEAQNTTSVQMKMFLTRMGEGTRMVVTGDLTQIDLPTGTRSGLADALDTLEGISGIGVARFNNSDVVRHPLVGRIVEAYDQRQAAAKEVSRERRG